MSDPLASRRHEDASTPARVGVGVALGAALAFAYGTPAARLGFWEPWETSLATLGRYIATTDGVSPFAPLRDGTLVGKSWLETSLLTLGYRIGGGSELGFRLPLVALTIAAALTAYAVLARTFGTARAGATAAIFGLMPLTLLSGSSLAGDAPYIAILTVTLLAAGTVCADPDRRPVALPITGALLGFCFWGHGFVGLGLPLAVLAVFAVGARDEDSDDATLLPLLAGSALMAAGLGLPVALALSSSWESARDLLGVGATIVAPIGLLVAAAPNSRARALFHPVWTPVAALAFAAVVAVPAATLLANTDAAGATQYLLYDDFLSGRVLPAHVTFDVIIRLVGGAAYPAVMFVPFGFAYLFRSTDGPTAESDDVSDVARVIKQLIGVWMAVGFLFAGLSISLSGHVSFALALPMAAAVGLGLGDRRYRQALARNRSGLYLAAFATLMLLVVTSKDLRGTYDLELGRPGPHVLFEPLLTDGSVEFPKTYALQHINIFFGLWALVALGAFAQPLENLDSVRRLVFRRREPARAAALVRLDARFGAGWEGTAALAALVGTMFLWGANVAVADLPSITNHLSQKGILDSFERLAPEGETLYVAGVDASDNSYYLGGEGVERLGRVADVRGLLCDDARRFVVVPFDHLAEAHNAARRSDASDEECPNGAPFYVVDGRSTRYVLASNQLDAGEEDQSVIAQNVFTRDTLPEGAVPVTADIVAGDDELRLVAYEISPSEIDHGELYVSAFWEVLKTPSAAWEVFIHVDYRGNRLNGDHQPVGDHYPTRYWVPGEIVRDRFPVEVSRADRSGEYSVFYGFFRGDTRMTLSNAESDNRYRLGTVRVR